MIALVEWVQSLDLGREVVYALMAAAISWIGRHLLGKRQIAKAVAEERRARQKEIFEGQVELYELARRVGKLEDGKPLAMEIQRSATRFRELLPRMLLETAPENDDG